MKKKGFTLVELLAVIVLIGLLSILLVPKMIERFEIKKEELSNQAKELIYLATSQYMEVFNSDASCVSIRDLIDNGFLIEPVIDPKSNTVISTSTSVKISKKNNQYNYEISDTCFYDVTFDLKRVSVDRKDFTMKDESVEVTITPNNNFILPDTINVKGSNYTWNKDTGKLVLKNAYSNVIVKIAGVPIDKENPTIIVSPSSGSYEGSVSITISVNDNLGLDPNNVYQYYLSTSSTKRENGSWTSYTSDVPFEITGDDETKYLWIWPVKDSVGNINSDKSNVNTPYVVGIYKFGKIDKTPPVLTVNESGYNNFEDGAVIYYDVLTGKPCTNYHEDNSKTNYNGTSSTKTTDNQNSCLKFYAFNYDEGDTTVNLLLDHNTTDYVYWNSSGSNSTGPSSTFLTQLKTNTDSWIGTLTPANYTVSQTTGGNYTIDYSDYKARLITANEIAEITGNTNFDESTSDEENDFYFDTNTKLQSSTCREGNTSGCSYGWLYDRTSDYCIDYGCLNNSNNSYGGTYWTSTSTFEHQYRAWVVSFFGKLYSDYVSDDANLSIRPVIEVLKSNLEKQIVINAYDNESGLSSGNNYQYYLSTSSTTLENGTWTNYTIGKPITINQDKNLYVWIYPVKDNAGNVNDNKEFNTPYVTLKLEKIYTITYDLNGGVLSTANASTYTNETDTFTLTNPTKSGYIFTGWTGSNGTTPNTNVTIEKGSIGNKNYTANWKLKVYTDGAILYYDVLKGIECSNYHENNSLIGYNGTSSTKIIDSQNSCLKFYVFNYDEGDTTVNLLLDHNTTASVYWTNSSTNSNTNGPIEVINQLKTDTSSWVGTLTPANYTVSQTRGGNYTIDYSTYKARLITAQEIAEITGNISFNESTASTSDYFYFDTNTNTDSDTCKYGNTTGCSYGWLYDRTSTSCTKYGCLNKSEKMTSDYFTGTSVSDISSRAWYVDSDGSLRHYDVDSRFYSVRPVIEVLKSNL